MTREVDDAEFVKAYGRRKLQSLGHNGVVPSFDQTIPLVVSSRANRHETRVDG